MPVKVLGSNGYGYSTDIIEGIIWVADNGADVINLSLGMYDYSQAIQDAVNYAYNKGIVIAAAEMIILAIHLIQLHVQCNISCSYKTKFS